MKAQDTRHRGQGAWAFYLCLASCVLCLGYGVAVAQPYPAKPVRVVVGFSAGGATDLSARFLAAKMSETLGQQVVVDDRPGAASMLAAEIVAKSPPDGHTVLIANATIAMPSLFKKLPFDIRKDFVPVTLVGYGPLVLVVHPSLPVKNVKDLVALAKRRPGTLNFGSAGIGSMTHLGIALFTTLAGINLTHVPYKGSSQASIGLMTGEVQLMFSSPAAVMTPMKEKKMRPLAVSGTTRSAVLPDVPTMIQAGIAGYDATSWYGMLAPAATPRTAIDRLGEESAKALTAADLKEKLLNLGIEPAKGGVDEFSGYFKSEIAKWEKVIRAAGIPPQ
ncbi:MAG TPA: tripartite tricarboxylate transporter substrate binding protein [Burkholderiales bacterium]|nr:tripartite tricarboxylate transporter substrate binding protein [Burkholderiales bacterium]